MGSLLSRKALSIGREGKLKKVTGSEANKKVAADAVNMRAGPGSRIAFEADDCHVGSDPA